MFKLSLALDRSLELSLAVGAVDWQFTDFPEDNERRWWSEGYKPLLGMGGWIEPLHFGPVSLFLTAHAMTHAGKGAFYLRQPVYGTPHITQWWEMKQRVFVGTVGSGFAIVAGHCKFLLGIDGRKWGRSFEVGYQRKTASGWEVSDRAKRNEWWGARYGPFLGVEWRLPGRFFVSVEWTRWFPHEHALTLGLGQTGPP